MITLQHRVQRNPNTAARDVKGQAFVMTPEDSTLHQMNDTASLIWGFLAEPRTVAAIVQEIHREFDCDEKTAEGDVLSHLEELREKGLVEISPPS